MILELNSILEFGYKYRFLCFLLEFDLIGIIYGGSIMLEAFSDHLNAFKLSKDRV